MRGIKEQLLKTSGADVVSSRKKLRKTLGRGGIHPLLSPPLVRLRVNLHGLVHDIKYRKHFIGSLNAKTASLCMICTLSSGLFESFIIGFHNFAPILLIKNYLVVGHVGRGVKNIRQSFYSVFANVLFNLISVIHSIFEKEDDCIV